MYLQPPSHAPVGSSQGNDWPGPLKGTCLAFHKSQLVKACSFLHRSAFKNFFYSDDRVMNASLFGSHGRAVCLPKVVGYDAFQAQKPHWLLRCS